jgi:hypothetical protein
MRNLIIIIFLFLCISCSTSKYIEVPIETTKTEYINQIEYKIDSIYIKDSIDRYVKGDTVYIEKWKITYKYKDRIVADTIIKIDSIQTPVYIETVKEVNSLKGYQYFLFYSGLLFYIVLGYILYKYIKRN